MRISLGVAHHAKGKRKVFLDFSQNPALEQSHLAWKATAFQACGFVQYALK